MGLKGLKNKNKSDDAELIEDIKEDENYIDDTYTEDEVEFNNVSTKTLEKLKEICEERFNLKNKGFYMSGYKYKSNGDVVIDVTNNRFNLSITIYRADDLLDDEYII